MRITALKLFPYSVPRQYATVIAQAGGRAKQAVERSQFLFLRLSTDTGLTGWGEVSDIEPGDNVADVAAYEAELADLMRGRDPFAVQQMHRDFREHCDQGAGSLARYTACALDMAMYDLQGRACKVPIHSLLGGAVRQRVVVSWVAYIRAELDALRDEVRQRRAEGFRAYKLKVGVDLELDEARLAVLRREAGSEASIKVDANAGWSVDDAPRAIRRLSRFGLAGVETPVPRENPADIAAVRRQVDVPILEHVGDPAYALALVKAEAVDVFNIATTGCGGLWPARQVAAIAQAAGLGVLLGSTVELGPGTLAQLHLAATVANLTLPSDLIGPGMYVGDVLSTPLAYERGTLSVPQGPGLGGEVDEAKLRVAARAQPD